MRQGERKSIDRYLEHGISALNDVEVIDILLGLKSDRINRLNQAQKYLNHYHSLANVIASVTNKNALENTISERHQFGLRLPHDIANRYLLDGITNSKSLVSSKDVIQYLQHFMRGLDVEQFKVLYLNGQNQIIKNDNASTGTINNAAVYPREIIKSALQYNASSLILAHNHPSGSIIPSNSDRAITKKIVNAAGFLDIDVLDHIIIGGDQYFSFSDNGLM